MARASILSSDFHVAGTLTCESFNPPAGSISNAAVSATAAIAASKIQHQFPLTYTQAPGSDVASATALIHLANASGSIVSVLVSPITAPTGGDKAFTVDVKKGNESTAFATVLTSVVTINSTIADREVVSGTITDADYIADDLLEVVVTTSGSTGDQGQGLIVSVFVEEYPS